MDFFYLHLVDVLVNVGQYTSPMDASWDRMGFDLEHDFHLLSVS